MESNPLAFLAFVAPDQLPAGEKFPPAAISAEPTGELNISIENKLEYNEYTTIDSVMGCPVKVGGVPAWESTPQPPADPSIADPSDQLCIKSGWLKPVWIGNVLNDSSETIQLEISDASENPEGLPAFNASTNDIWIDDTQPESSTFQEVTGLSDSQNDSESPHTQLEESIAVDIDHAPIPLELDAELSQISYYAYSFNSQLTFETDPIPGTSGTEEAVGIGHDYSVIYAERIDDPTAPLTGEKHDSVDSLVEILPWDESGNEPEISICQLGIAPYSQSILPTEESIDPAGKSIDLPQEFSSLPGDTSRHLRFNR